MLLIYAGLTSFYMLSPFCTHRKSSSETKSLSMFNAHKSSRMTILRIVSRASKKVYKKLATSTSTERSTERYYRKVESAHNAEFTATSGLDKIRQNLLVGERISNRASNLITDNRRASSIKHYKPAWN